MLLRHTPTEIKERKALTVNPAKTCQPIGAMYASLGIHGCLPHSHGSQGCYAYHRSALTRHFKEPVAAATSAFTEGASVFGGQANLLQSIDNIFTVYNPDVIAVHTTCLSETIGDDIPQIVAKARADGKAPAGKYIIHANTPSYVGSHVTGYSNMVKAMVDYFSTSTGAKTKAVNLIPGFVEPSDMAEIQRIAEVMGVPYIMFPDTSKVLNGPLTGKYKMFPDGGTTIEDLHMTGDSKGTIALGRTCTMAAARALDSKCKVPCEILDLPIGLQGTDEFVDKLRLMAGVNVPDVLNLERGQLVDCISDWHQYLYGKRVGVVGDPDQVLALTRFLVSLDMKPVHIVSGSPAGKKYVKALEEVVADIGEEVNIKVPGDMLLFHQWIKNDPVDLIIGNTYCKYIAKDEDIPFVRHGFPIYDRMGHSYFSTMGYRGAMRLMEQILGVLMDRQDRDATDITMELVM
ncbi:Mo-nitrogenase MoFe protein subunit NifK [Desulfatibacillum alkenivorans DSM 16219]|jgi:nitrogenase molybdenum-iron protein beta chain|uniref:Nitrogenase molybdenum-iron protein beta chain n=1 Tax=Desulfatibacillum alkenivorans DSM 16219 TaxID=1121393 RepID=A0A1M6WWY5_9BACT|nr:nitrogenase molybdenum-iron protein subunit beta [Desulfatibacillum alkenivorans]SHK98203.1 Mo-nitrogenase MoFe protein subunit NifK [Desulfatibacillum alkenivorans DSM 16219]